jgi:glycopeptide antibiotics resistance protein
MNRRVVIAWSVVALVAALLTWIALGHTGPSDRGEFRLIPFTHSERMMRCLVQNCSFAERAARFLLIDILGNIVVFSPLGVALYFAISIYESSRARTILIATLIGMIISIIYEVAQIWIPGRAVATDDVILNTLGTGLGAWSASLLKIRTVKHNSVSLNHER